MTILSARMWHRRLKNQRRRASTSWLRCQSLEERCTPALLTVTSSADDNIGLTLRKVMETADTNSEADTISFAPGVTTIQLALGQISMGTDTTSLTINGAGVTVSGAATPGPTNRIFNFAVATGNPTFFLNGLTLTGGNLDAGNGGAILMDNDPVELNGVTFNTNTTLGAGGAIATGTAATTLKITNCSFSTNSSGTTGGAVNIGAAATVTVNGSTFTSNSAGTNGGAIQTGTTVTLNIADSSFVANLGNIGGAVRALNSNSTITINRSTFTGNSAKSGGGGGFYMAGGSLEVTASTFDNNSASTNGGGLGMTSATAAIINCTISTNQANGGTGTGGGGITVTTGNLTVYNSTITGNTATNLGGGIRKTSATGSLTLHSTIVAANSATTGPDIGFTPTTTLNVGGGKNLVGVATGNFALAGVNETGTSTMPLSPMLFPLTSNGGPTHTHALMPGSKALNNGSNLLSLTTDQRGGMFPRTLSTATDVGSFEDNNVTPLATPTLPNVPPINPTYIATVVYTDEAGIDTVTIDVNDVVLSGPGFPTAAIPTGVAITGSGKSVTAKYTFNPPGGSWEWTDNGKYTLVMQADQVFDIDLIPNAVVAGPLGSFIVNTPLPPTLLVDDGGEADDGKYTAGNLTLREALNLANLSAGTTETITFAASLNGQTITLLSAMAITDPVVITGPGATQLSISGGDAVRIFNIDPTSAGAAVAISGLTLTNGREASGGAMLVADPALTLTRCVFTNNVGLSGIDSGGAIRITEAAGALTITECWFDNNSSTGGGAIVTQNGAGLLITNSLFTNNATIGGNAGGALRIGGPVGPFGVTIRNSTFTANKSNFTGGAIGFAGSFVGNALIQNCTIVNNSADNDGGAGIGGGVGVVTGAMGTVTIESSIVTGNFKNAGMAASDIGSPNTITVNKSILGTAVDASMFVPDGSTTALLGQDPMLDILADNGGPTQTMKLLTGSPALNAGSNPAALATDQRGTGFARQSGSAVDIGAFEVQVATPPQVATIKVNDGSAQRSLVKSIQVTFTAPVTIGGGAFVLQRYGPGMLSGTVGVVVQQLGGDVTLTFDNTGSLVLDPGGSLPDGQYELKIIAANVSNANGTLDGNSNGVADGSPIDDVSSKVHRLFGDANGDGAVTATDFNAFRLDYGSAGPSIFDFDGIGGVTAIDFNAFRLRYGVGGYLP